jgi:hypothetical protein
MARVVMSRVEKVRRYFILAKDSRMKNGASSRPGTQAILIIQ